jgi:3-oxoacyl-[acyl-carrier-protein] synthase-1
MVDGAGNPLVAGFDALLDPERRGLPRLVDLAAAPLEEVRAKLEDHPAPSVPVPVLLASPEPRPGFSDADGERLTTLLQSALLPEGVLLQIELGARGHAAALSGLEQAVQRLRGGHAELCLVAGADSYLEADTLDWLEENRQLAGEGRRGGFIPGEAAGAVLLASDAARRRLRLPSLAVVRGAASSRETRLIKSDADCFGQGLAEAIAAAAHGLRLPDEAPDAIYCDLNGERYRSEEWGFAALRLSQILRRLDTITPQDCWGEVGAASGVLGCVLAVQSWSRGYAPGPRALIFGGSEGGLRGAAVLERSDG